MIKPIIRVLHTDEGPAIYWRAAGALGGRELDRLQLQDAFITNYWPAVESASRLTRAQALELVAPFVDIQVFDAWVDAGTVEVGAELFTALQHHLGVIEKVADYDNAGAEVKTEVNKIRSLMTHYQRPRPRTEVS